MTITGEQLRTGHNGYAHHQASTNRPTASTKSISEVHEITMAMMSVAVTPTVAKPAEPTSKYYAPKPASTKSIGEVHEITMAMMNAAVTPSVAKPAEPISKYNAPKTPSPAVNPVACRQTSTAVQQQQQQQSVQQVLAHYASSIAVAQLPDNVREESLVRVFISEVMVAYSK